MTKAEKLDQLYEKWQVQVLEYKDHFIKDGIINEDKFNAQKRKILFIAKEPRDAKQKEWDFRVWWNESLNYNFSYRLSEWAYGILNEFPVLEAITREMRLNAIQSVAFINLKKIGGLGSSNYPEIIEHLRKNKELLREQIEIINPDIIVGSVTWLDVWPILFEGIKIKTKVFDTELYSYNAMKIIHYCHPSNRYPSGMKYALLKCVFESNEFKNL